MELDPVTQAFEADTAPFVAGIDVALESLQNYRDSVYETIAAIEALNAAMAANTGGAGFETESAAVRDVRDELLEMLEAENAAAEAARAAGDAAAGSAAGFETESGAVRDFRDEAIAMIEAENAAAEAAARAGEEAAAAAAGFEGETAAMRDARDAAIELAMAEDASDLGGWGQALGISRAEAEALGIAVRATSENVAASAGDFDTAAHAAVEAAEDDALLAESEQLLADATAARRDADIAAAQAGYTLITTTRQTDQAVADAANGASSARRIWGLLPMTFNAIHWAITGVGEALAVIVPAMIAAGSAAAVGLQGAVDVAQRMDVAYQATEATASYLGKTISTGLGQGLDSFTASAGQAAGAGNNLRDTLQQAQDAAQPQVYELLGAVIDGATGKFSQFAEVGGQVIDVMDAFAAKVDIELQGPLSGLAGEISRNAVPDLTELGQVFGNLGHALADVAQAEPGMAELLLRILDDGTQVLDWALHFKDVLAGLFLLHEAQMWGGLLSGALSSVTSALASGVVALGAWTAKAIPFESAAAGVEEASLTMGTALEGTAGFLAGGWGTALVGAGLAVALLTDKFHIFQDATQQWISSLEQTIAQASGLQQMAATYEALSEVQQRLTQSQQQYSEMSFEADVHQSDGLRVLGQTVNGYTIAAGQAQNANRELSAAQQQLTTDWNTENSNVQYLASTYKVSYVDAAELAGDAGVSLTQSMRGTSVAAQEARQQINNLIAGYGGMASVGSELGQDMNALSFSTDLQNGDVTKLNQAWDTFISTVQGPSSGFLGFAQSLDQFANDAKAAGASMSGLGGSVAAAASPVNSASIQLQQDFNSSVSSAETLLDSLRTVATVTGNGGPLVSGIKDVVAAMIPMAGSNQAAQAQLFALAQEAGGPASGSLASLSNWVGKTADPMNQLYSLSMKASGALQNLSQDAQSVAATIASTLNQQLVNEAESLTGVSGKMADYLSDLQKLGPDSAATQAALGALNSAQGQANDLAATGAANISTLSGKVTQLGNAAAESARPQTQLNKDIEQIQAKAPAASADINALATAIAGTGMKGQETSAARQALISDLERMHVSAQTAASWVNQLAAAINGLHSKSITIGVQEAIESNGAVHPAGGIPVPHAASGMRVPGYGGGDIVPAWLEPGEAVVPKHLVPAVAPFLGAHHVPGFAEGGMAGVAELWARELWTGDRSRYGRHAPVSLTEMAALWAATEPGHSLPKSALAALLGADERSRIGSYRPEDTRYWDVAKRMSISRGTEHDNEEKLAALRAAAGRHPSAKDEAAELALEKAIRVGVSTQKVYAEEMRTIMKSMGYAAGGLVPFGSYDAGGFLPPGLSMAYNGTGRPEPVGAARTSQPLHVHLHMNGREVAQEIIPDLVAATADYNYQNTGRVTGLLYPGG